MRLAICPGPATRRFDSTFTRLQASLLRIAWPFLCIICAASLIHRPEPQEQNRHVVDFKNGSSAAVVLFLG
jgi:hypothetical protein